MRKSFTRLGTTAQINQSVKTARDAGFEIIRQDKIVITAMTIDGVVIFSAVRIRPKMWAITYMTEFYGDPDGDPGTNEYGP